MEKADGGSASRHEAESRQSARWKSTRKGPGAGGFTMTTSAEASGLASLPHPWASHTVGKKKRELLFDELLLCARQSRTDRKAWRVRRRPLESEAWFRISIPLLQALVVGSTEFPLFVPLLCNGDDNSAIP